MNDILLQMDAIRFGLCRKIFFIDLTKHNCCLSYKAMQSYERRVALYLEWLNMDSRWYVKLQTHSLKLSLLYSCEWATEIPEQFGFCRARETCQSAFYNCHVNIFYVFQVFTVLTFLSRLGSAMVCSSLVISLPVSANRLKLFWKLSSINPFSKGNHAISLQINSNLLKYFYHSHIFDVHEVMNNKFSTICRHCSIITSVVDPFLDKLFCPHFCARRLHQNDLQLYHVSWTDRSAIRQRGRYLVKNCTAPWCSPPTLSIILSCFKQMAP